MTHGLSCWHQSVCHDYCCLGDLLNMLMGLGISCCGSHHLVFDYLEAMTVPHAEGAQHANGESAAVIW